MTRHRWAACALALVWALVAGCSPSSDAESSDDTVDEASAIVADARTKGSPEQVEALADGQVSVEEMEASIEAFQDCLATTHWRLEEVYPDPIAGEPHFTYQVVADRAGRDDAELNECDLETFRFVNVFAQVIQEPAPMDPALRARTLACLDDAGAPTSPDDRTSEDVFITAGSEHTQIVTDCTLKSYLEIFPDRAEPSLAIPSEVAGN